MIIITGRITQAESIFWYEEGTTSDTFQNPDYMPITLLDWDSAQEEQAAEELCDGDQACLYDFFVTKDTTFAQNTKSINEKNIDLEADLGIRLTKYCILLC